MANNRILYCNETRHTVALAFFFTVETPFWGQPFDIERDYSFLLKEII